MVTLFPEAVSQISKNGLLNPAHRIRTEQKRVHELFFGFCIFFLFVQSNSNLIVDYWIAVIDFIGLVETDTGRWLTVGSQVFHPYIQMCQMTPREQALD